MKTFLTIIGIFLLTGLSSSSAILITDLIGNEDMTLGATSKTVFYNGDNPYFLTGNLGIGTNNPAYKLEVNGTGYFADDVTISGNLVATDYRGTWDSLATTSFLSAYGSFYGDWDGLATTSFLSSTGDFRGTWDSLTTTTLPYLSSSLTDWTGTWDGYATNTLPYLLNSASTSLAYLPDTYTMDDFTDGSDYVRLATSSKTTYDALVSFDIDGLDATTTIVDENTIAIQQTSNIFKSTWTTVKAFLKTYFDTLYLALAGGTMAGDIAMGSNDITGVDEIVGASSTFTTINEIPFTASSTNWEYVYDTKLATSTFCYTSVASTSMADLEDQTIVIAPSNMKIVKQKCKVKNGTSIVVNASDGTNDMTSITCGTALTSNFPSSNNTFTEGEAMQIEYGTNTGSSDYLETICFEFIKL